MGQLTALGTVWWCACKTEFDLKNKIPLNTKHARFVYFPVFWEYFLGVPDLRTGFFLVFLWKFRVRPSGGSLAAL